MYNLMKWDISSRLFTKLDDFLPFVILHLHALVIFIYLTKNCVFCLSADHPKTEIRFFNHQTISEAEFLNQEQLLYCT